MKSRIAFARFAAYLFTTPERHSSKLRLLDGGNSAGGGIADKSGTGTAAGFGAAGAGVGALGAGTADGAHDDAAGAAAGATAGGCTGGGGGGGTNTVTPPPGGTTGGGGHCSCVGPAAGWGNTPSDGILLLGGNVFRPGRVSATKCDAS